MIDSFFFQFGAVRAFSDRPSPSGPFFGLGKLAGRPFNVWAVFLLSFPFGVMHSTFSFYSIYFVSSLPTASLSQCPLFFCPKDPVFPVASRSPRFFCFFFYGRCGFLFCSCSFVFFFSGSFLLLFFLLPLCLRRDLFFGTLLLEIFFFPPRSIFYSGWHGEAPFALPTFVFFRPNTRFEGFHRDHFWSFPPIPSRLRFFSSRGGFLFLVRLPLLPLMEMPVPLYA